MVVYRGRAGWVHVKARLRGLYSLLIIYELLNKYLLEENFDETFSNKVT